MADCRVVRAASATAGKSGLPYFPGISAESVGAKGICLHLGTIPPGAAAEPHLHEAHETAIYVLSGRAGMRYGAELEEEVRVEAGDFLYIGPGVPHQPFNASDSEPVRFVVARTDPNEQESTVLLPHLAQKESPSSSP